MVSKQEVRDKREYAFCWAHYRSTSITRTQSKNKNVQPVPLLLRCVTKHNKLNSLINNFPAKATCHGPSVSLTQVDLKQRAQGRAMTRYSRNNYFRIWAFVKKTAIYKETKIYPKSSMALTMTQYIPYILTQINCTKQPLNVH